MAQPERGIKKMFFEIRFDDTAGAFEVYEVQRNGDWIWMAAFDSRKEALAWVAKHTAGAE
jgi:hypothetical protein